MFQFNKFVGLPILASTTLLAAIAVMAASKAQTEYQLVAYQDCQVVHTAKLNAEQVAAYHQLNQESVRMQELERPIKSLRPSLNALQLQMTEVSRQAVQQSEAEIRIDRQAMAKQELIASKIEALMEQHQQDFAALESQGRSIQLAADRFETLIDSAMPTAEFDHVQIFDGSEQHRSCGQQHKLM